MADCMMFPKDWHDFIKDYSFIDSERVYTNGSELIHVFRVEQLIDHLMAEKQAEIERLKEENEKAFISGQNNILEAQAGFLSSIRKGGDGE